MANSSKKRLLWLDSAKGFAIVMVVWGHIAHGYLAAGMFADSTGTLTVLENLAYSFHMPMFFILSGFSFGMAYVEGSENYRLKSSKIRFQLGNIITLYFVWSIIQWIFKTVLSSYVNSEFTLADLLLMPLKAMAPYWYLYVLAICYVLTCFFIRKKLEGNCILAVSAAVCIAGFWIVGLPEKLGGFTITALMALSYYFFFAVGVFLSKRRKYLGILKKTVAITAFLVVGVVLGLIFSFCKGESMNWSGVFFFGCPMALSLSLGFIGLAQKFPLRLSAFLGRYSLEIFLVHCFITAANRKLLPTVGINNLVVSFILNLILALFIPVAVSMLLKKLKIRDLFFNPFTFVFRHMQARRKITKN